MRGTSFKHLFKGAVVGFYERVAVKIAQLCFLGGGGKGEARFSFSLVRADS